MHFTQIFAAIMALPALSIAAAVPRANGFQSCSNFATLTVGTLFVNTVNVNTVDSVDVRIRPDNTGNEGWKVIATVPKGSPGYTIDVGKFPGVWNVEICDSLPYLSGGGACTAPAGYGKLWRFRATGDRWYFTTAVKSAKGYRLLESDCVASDDKVTDTPTVTVTATPTVPPTPTTSISTSVRSSSSSSTTTKVISSSTSTSTNIRTTSTSTRTSTSSTKTSTSTSTRRN